MRAPFALLVIAALLASAAGIEHQLGLIPREDPLGRQLLYLPTAEYFDLLSMGNRELVADFIYLWSIQYYGQFKPNERYLYLDKIFNLITDLDPLFRDPYRIGATIMLIESQRDPESRKATVLGLLDKGIEAMPDDYYLAEEAAWKCHIFFKDNKLAAEYAKIAASHPNAPHWTKRFFGHLKSETWSLDEAITYWADVLDEAQSDYQRMVSRNHLYDLIVQKDKQLYEPFLEEFRNRFGRCPRNWGEIISSGITVNGDRLIEPPKDFFENEYGLDVESCTLIAEKKIKED